jgi:hypothetical protein
MKIATERMPSKVMANYAKYIVEFLEHRHAVYTSITGNFNVWDNDLRLRISLEPEWFEKDMEQARKKAA